MKAERKGKQKECKKAVMKAEKMVLKEMMKVGRLEILETLLEMIKAVY